MRRDIRMALTALLVFLSFWVGSALVDVGIHPGVPFGDVFFSPTAREFQVRLLGGMALAGCAVVLMINRRRQAGYHEKLERQEQIFYQLLADSPDCILITVDHVLVFANANARRFLGLDDEIMRDGIDPRDFLVPHSRSAAMTEYDRLVAGVQQSPLLLEIRRHDGAVREVESTNSHITWKDQPAILTFFRDVTEDKQNRQELVANSERLRLALEAARDGVWDWNITNDRMIYSESWATMLGYQLEEITDGLETWRTLIHPRDYLRAQTLLNNHLEGFVPGYEIEVRLRHKKGHYIWVLDRGRVVERDSQGHPLRMTGTHRDITARKEAELALEVRNRVAEAFLISSADNLFAEILTIICAALETPFGLFSTLDPQSNLQIVAATPETEVTTRLLQDEPSFHRNALPKVLDTLINQGRYVLENDGVAPPDFPLSLRCLLGVPISNRQQILGAVFVGDKEGGLEQPDRLFLESLAGYIAPLLQAHLKSEHKETQLRQAQKMEALGSLAGGIAHDFNNILQAIMGFTTLALEDVGPEGHPPGDLQRVLKATRRGQELVQRILLFSRRDEKKHEPVLIESVVQEALNLLQPSTPATIQISARLDAPGAYVVGDPSQISQVLLNLATNAHHAMEPDGGILDIGLSLLPGGVFHPGRPETLEGLDLVVLTISDTGSGMSDSVKARLFDPFFTTKEVGQGTGLGMSMVHGIVQDHGGEILVHSELEIGTTVTVFLPQLSATELSGEDPATFTPRLGPQAHGHRHVALVDDEEDITDLGSALLQRAGYQVTARNNGHRILDLVQENPRAFDLVVTDLTMPQITGLQLARKLEETAPSLPVLLITGMTEERPLDLQGYPNIKGLIRKPFGREVLLGQVDSILRQFNPVEGG